MEEEKEVGQKKREGKVCNDGRLEYGEKQGERRK